MTLPSGTVHAWDSIIPNLVSGNYDAIMAGMSITEEREEVINSTDEDFPKVPSAYVAASQEADFESGTVAAQVHTIQAAHVAESGATLLEFSSTVETVAAVRNGEADAVLADRDFIALMGGLGGAR